MAKKKIKDTVEYTIELPKQNKYFYLIRKFLEDVLGTENIPDAERDGIILAVNETCDKIVRLDAEDTKNIKINIRIKVQPKKITILLSHKGATVLPKYFQMYNEEQVILEAVKNRIGDYLIEKSADEVSFSSSKKKGQNIKIVKFRGKGKK